MPVELMMMEQRRMAEIAAAQDRHRMAEIAAQDRHRRRTAFLLLMNSSSNDVLESAEAPHDVIGGLPR